MPLIKTLCIGFIICCQSTITIAQTNSAAQSDTAYSTQQALSFADSLIKANFYQEWETYISLSCATAVKYYGGKESFKEHIIENYYRNEPSIQEKPVALRMVTLMTDRSSEWQCVIEKLRDTYGENSRKEKIYTYLVGQSTDNGQNWKFIDVGNDDIRNVIYIMPNIFGSLAIPEKKIVFDDEVEAQKTPAPKTTSKKKAVTTKKP
jgi:hypothetical protein